MRCPPSCSSIYVSFLVAQKYCGKSTGHAPGGPVRPETEVVLALASTRSVYPAPSAFAVRQPVLGYSKIGFMLFLPSLKRTN